LLVNADPTGSDQRPETASARRKSGLGDVGAHTAADLAYDAIERHYGDTVALGGVSLHVAAGEIVCLLGPSGCGKTTLLRIASGVERPTRGRVLIGGREVVGPTRYVPPENRHVGLMFQDFALFPHLTILDNVAFGLKALPRVERQAQARAGLARVGMLGHAGKSPHMLSGGEQQRVALARAIVPRPAVMLMDEPFSGLDVHLRERLQEETVGLLRETRATTIIVTHHPEEAMRIADRIAVMRQGRLVQVGQARDLHGNPADLFVARLFSEINEVPWSVAKGALETPLGTFPAPGLEEGAAAVLCVRQRALELASSGDGLSAQVVSRKSLGDTALLDLAIDGLAMPLRALVAEGRLAGLADTVKVRIDRSQVLVFQAGRDETPAASPRP